VRDNGKPQPITVFDNSPQPIQLIVMLDVSTSMAGNLPLLREASGELFSRLRPDDGVKVGTFGRTIEISPEFTNDRARLQALVPETIDPDAPTPLWRAADQAMSAFGSDGHRKVVLLLSDGKDSGQAAFAKKFYSQLDVIDRALAEDVMIYAIGMRSRSAQRPVLGPGANAMALMAADMPDPGLGKVAVETGGGYFELVPRDDFGRTFARVAEELHSQYLLGFSPPVRDGKTHRIEVRLAGRDYKPRARKSYLAPKANR
jgi:VWFA-related protein